MAHHEKTHGPSAAAGLNFFQAIVLLLGFTWSAPFSRAQTTPVITNLAQLTQSLHATNHLTSPVRLEATVFACSTNSGTLVVVDGSGVELLEIDDLEHEFRPGDQIEIDLAPALIRSSNVGIRLSTVPLLDDDGTHGPRTESREYPLNAGRYPVRVDWFNQHGFSQLEVFCVATNLADDAVSDEFLMSKSLLHVLRAECYEGNWLRIPNFQLLEPSKTGSITNFDTMFRTREELVGMRFEGYVEVPKNGTYLFSLRSDDGSQLWLGNPAVPVKELGTNGPPLAPLIAIGEPMTGLDQRRLVTIEGRVSFVSRFGKGLRLEMRSEPNSVSVIIADAGCLRPEDLLNACVRISGVAAGALAGDQRVLLGRLAVASSGELTILENAPGKRGLASVLTSVLQVHNLTANDAARELPVAIRGVVTAVAPGSQRWITIQDDTRGSFATLRSVSNCVPNVGEFWEITGHTASGDFAPIIVAEQARLLGRGRLPEPVHPTWNELANGSMDIQWAELSGLVSAVHSNWISLLLPEGREEIQMEGWGESEAKEFDKAVVRVRGTLFAIWNKDTHEVQVGGVVMHNASIAVDKPAPANPFDAPEKTPRGLFLFDAKATPFQPVKVRGHVTYADSKCIFIEQGDGIQIFPASRGELHMGDVVEAVGYPDLSGGFPLLREALIRKIGDSVLPEPPLVSDAELTQGRLASARIRIIGTLAGQHREEDTSVLQVQTRSHLLLARVANAGSLVSLRPGSRLLLTGICLSETRNNAPAGETSRFELLVNSPGEIVVLSRPSWWTLRRLLSVVGVLLVTLALAAAWINQLRRQVAQRTFQLQHEIRERERAERQHALEAERSRIARDLHDDLGSSLTEINVLANTGQRPRPEENAHPALFKAISDKARSLISALDVIVWAVDPEDNSLQSLADYLGGYAREYLSNFSIACRFRIPVKLPNVTLDGEIRHELLMVVKETLNNIVRHADATEAEFQMNVTDHILEICITDNGRGFEPTGKPGGHGVKNCFARLAKIGGSCNIESPAGVGTTVRLQFPLPDPTTAGAKVNTTFG